MSDEFPAVLNETQKAKKLSNLLQKLKEDGMIDVSESGLIAYRTLKNNSKYRLKPQLSYLKLYSYHTATRIKCSIMIR